MEKIIIPTSQALHLAENLKKSNGNFQIVLPDLNREGARYFPDGEIYMGLSGTNDFMEKRVVVLHSGYPNPNEGLIELELILQILRDKKIVPEVFFSYFPYGMQDKVFDKGETNIAENIIEKLVNYYKVSKIYIIDAHFGGREWTKKYPLQNISASPILLDKAKAEFGGDIMFLSPDKGGHRRTNISGFDKKRQNSFNVEIAVTRGNFEGKIVAVVDDVIKTGGTLVKFCQVMQELGAKKILALVTHGVVDAGIEKAKNNFSKLYFANTIDKKDANVDITNLIIDTLK